VKLGYWNRQMIRRISAVVVAMSVCVPIAAWAANLYVESKIDIVFVNGGADSPNPGTTCIKLTNAVSASCGGSGLIAIPNNNSKLLAAALTVKATDGVAWVYYQETGASQHCPGIAVTTCNLISIGPK
jgi:hypothetical protein